MISPSRRTPRTFVNAIAASTADAPRILWDEVSDNPYGDFLAHADAFVVTADSVNMAGEAASTGKPVFIFTPSGGGAKFNRFHEGLQAHGITRPLPPDGGAFETWSYQPLDSARVIADEIARRWQIRCDMLPGLMTKPAP